MIHEDSNISIREFLDRYAGLIAKTERVTRVGRWVVELDTGRMWWTPEVYRIHGVDPKTCKLHIESATEFYSEPDRYKLYEAIQQSAQTGEPFDMELLSKQPAGKCLWVRVSGYAELNTTGGIRAFGLIQDINDRVIERTERQLYYELSPDMLCIVDQNGVMQHVNPSMVKETGYSASELVGRPFMDFVYSQDREATMKIFLDCVAGKPVDSFENRWVNKTGQAIWLQWRTITEPISQRVYASARNITGQKSIQDQLLRDAQILANITHMVVVTDSQGIIQYWNPEAERLLGWSADEVIGKHYGFRLKPELIAKGEANQKQIMAGVELEREWLDEHRSGRPVWLRVRARRLLDAQGNTIGSIAVCTDITNIKETQERLRLLLNEVDHRVKNNLASVISIARQTASASESLKQFQAAFEARIHGMVLSHNTLTEHKWKSVPLDGFLARVIAPFTLSRSDQLKLNGPKFAIAPSLVSPLGMVFNELATNAFKYGALSIPGGKVEITWQQSRATTLQLNWNETNGPRIETSGKPHMGMSVIRGLIEYQLTGHIDFDFQSDGLKVLITIPLPADEQHPEHEALSP